jgi:septal ring factor EnvC (AmiA/AmiB activator)
LSLCPPICFSGLVPRALRRIFQFQQNLEQLQQHQQIDQLRREQEQNQLQQQLNDIPHQPGEPMERRQQLNDLQQQLDQRQLVVRPTFNVTTLARSLDTRLAILKMASAKGSRVV